VHRDAESSLFHFPPFLFQFLDVVSERGFPDLGTTKSKSREIKLNESCLYVLRMSGGSGLCVTKHVLVEGSSIGESGMSFEGPNEPFCTAGGKIQGRRQKKKVHVLCDALIEPTVHVATPPQVTALSEIAENHAMVTLHNRTCPHSCSPPSSLLT
jgi:hypothetical protein